MRIDDLEWGDENIEHIAQHNVTPKEVEDVCFGLHISEKSGGDRYVLSGQTESGRYLNVVIERVGGGLFRPITAFDMSESYKRKYRKMLGK
ncbi:MAG: hypothetical protein A2Z15_04950 [Chloroflexi bacterium RBG_16_50_11]|nr:MAG: hypothetical protein A2Z15_04950 [Chloroflexi bacterium RBG_16_50_11]